jgi:hypothetical protein
VLRALFCVLHSAFCVLRSAGAEPQARPDIPSSSSDPLTVARELVATQRDLIFVTVESDRARAFVGAPVVVTWMLYNATTMQRFSIDEVPPLDDFWLEEIPVRNAVPEPVQLDEIRMQRVPVRRVVLYPLRSGTLAIGPMSVTAEALRHIGMDRFGIPYEARLVDITRRSPRIAVDALAIPPGPPVSAAGDLRLDCPPTPAAVQAGPVTLYASMSGRANLRAAVAPAFEGRVDGSVQVVDAGFKVDRSASDVVMSRRWRYVIFPARSGRLPLPPLVATILTPEGERTLLRCEARTIEAVGGTPASGETTTSETPGNDVARYWPWAVVLLGIAAGVAPLRALRRRRASVDALLRSTPSETKDAVLAWLDDHGGAKTQGPDCRDALGALISLLDAAERDRIPFERREVRRRIADVVETCAGTRRMAESQKS